MMIKQVKRHSTSLIMGSTNQNYSELPAHIYQDSYYPQTRKQVLVCMWRNRNPYSLLVGM